MTGAGPVLRAGAAAHNAGEHGVARAIWAGDTPLSDAADGDLFDGLAAFAAAVTGSRRGAWTAATEEATRAETALDATEAGVDLVPLRRWLAALRADPAMAERAPPPTVVVDGDRPTPGVLPLAAASVLAGAVAEIRGYDPSVVEDAVRFAHDDERPERTRYATFLRDFGADDSRRPIIFERLTGLVDRERRKEKDVAGLFD